jgi:hypothetical protein
MNQKTADSMPCRLAVGRPVVAADGGLHAGEGGGDPLAGRALHGDGATLVGDDDVVLEEATGMPSVIGSSRRPLAAQATPSTV